jgi:hypothetical protein
MRKKSLLACAVLALLLTAFSLHAQPWLEDGRSCFCLKHETGQLIRDCTGVKAGTDFYITATCRGSETGDRATTLTVEPPWTAIRDGDTGCRPCRDGTRATKELPRGEDTK